MRIRRTRAVDGTRRPSSDETDARFGRPGRRGMSDRFRGSGIDIPATSGRSPLEIRAAPRPGMLHRVLAKRPPGGDDAATADRRSRFDRHRFRVASGPPALCGAAARLDDTVVRRGIPGRLRPASSDFSPRSGFEPGAPAVAAGNPFRRRPGRSRRGGPGDPASLHESRWI
jgi:hypothetical protein